MNQIDGRVGLQIKEMGTKPVVLIYEDDGECGWVCNKKVMASEGGEGGGGTC